jgi:hypothetical protein
MIGQIMKRILFLLLTTITFSSFPSNANAGSAFAIFLSTSKDADLEQMKLSNEPFITDLDITKYIWKTHELVLSDEGAKQFRRFIETRPEGKQFVRFPPRPRLRMITSIVLSGVEPIYTKESIV